LELVSWRICNADNEGEISHHSPFFSRTPGPEDWPAWFSDEIDRRVPHMGLEGAQTRAMNAALNLWNFHHGSRGEPNRCAGCGGFLPASAAFTLADGATIHSGDAFTACLTAYGAKWRPAALAGLERLGVGFDVFEL
jgi:hypothetical protein